MSLKNKILILIAFALISFRETDGQQITGYSITQGLAHNNVTSFFHDQEGYFWIGTWDGLNRYDGSTFENFTRGAGDSTPNFDQQIVKISKDLSGNIWFLTYNTFNKYDRRKNTFTSPKFLNELDLPASGVPDFVFDNLGNGWYINELGLVSFEPSSLLHRFINISDFHYLQSSLAVDDQGLWIASSKGLLHFSFSTIKSNDTLTIAHADVWYRFNESRYPKKAHSIIRTTNGTFVIVFDDINDFNPKIFKSNEKNSTLEEVALPAHLSLAGNTSFSFITEIMADKILLSTQAPGVVVYDLKSGTFEFDIPGKNFFRNRSNYHVYYDHQHNLWLGGIDGLFKYSLPQLILKSWVFDAGKTGALSGKRITSVAKNNHHLWVGSRDGGLEKIDLRNDAISKITLPAELQKKTSTTNVFNIIPISDDMMLVNFGTVLFQYQIAQNSFSYLKTVDYLVYTHFRDSKGRLWLSERNKIVVLSAADFSVLMQFDTTTLEMYPTNSRQIFEDKNGGFWLTSGEGLIRLNVENPKESKLYRPPGNRDVSEIICMHENKDGTFWLGTLRQGILAFDPNIEAFTAHFHDENGLIDNSVNIIYEAENGFLWMSTWKGMIRMNPADTTFTNYSMVNGLPFPEFNTNAHFLDHDGTIYFGGEGGVIGFHPDSVVNFEIENKLAIQSVTSSNKLLPLNYPLKTQSKIRLPYLENDFSIKFSSFDLRHGDSRMYRYRLVGWRDEWRQTKFGDHTAEFAGLPAGKYNFQLQSTYAGWPWILDNLELSVVLENPPFYQEGNFQIALIIALALAVAIILLMRIRNKTMQREVILSRLEREANQYRLNFLKSQMNPHFYFNTLNSINSYILKNDTKAANKFLTTFAKLMREILENSQREFITVEEEKEVLEKYISLQQLRFPTTFRYRITAEDQVKLQMIPPMLVQPFVENAIEYAFVDMLEEGIVHVNFEMINKNIVCTITDNGIGISNSQKIRAGRLRKSAAIKNIGQRIEMLNKIFKVSIQLLITPLNEANERFPGTQVRLIIPILSTR